MTNPLPTAVPEKRSRGLKLDNTLSAFALISTVFSAGSWLLGRFTRIVISSEMTALVALLALLLWSTVVARLPRHVLSGGPLPWPSDFWALILNRLSTHPTLAVHPFTRVVVVSDETTADIYPAIDPKFGETGVRLEELPLKRVDAPQHEQLLANGLVGADAVYFILTEITKPYVPGLRRWATGHSANAVLIVCEQEFSPLVPDFTRISLDRAAADFWKLFAQATLRGTQWEKRSTTYHRVALVCLIALVILVSALIVTWTQRDALAQQVAMLNKKAQYVAVWHDAFPPAFARIAKRIRVQGYVDGALGDISAFLIVVQDDCARQLGVNAEGVSVSLWELDTGANPQVRKIASTRESKTLVLASNSYIGTAIRDSCIIEYSDWAKAGDPAAWTLAGAQIGTSNDKGTKVVITSSDGEHSCSLVPGGTTTPKEMVCIGHEANSQRQLGMSLTIFDSTKPVLTPEVRGTLRRALAIVGEAYSPPPTVVGPISEGVTVP